MKPIKNERGQSLVELAISLVLLLLLVSGIVEFGMAFFQFVQLRDAAQEGALYGSIHPSDLANIEARVRGASSSPINLADTSKVTVTISIDGVPSTDTSGYTAIDCEGHGLKVKVSFNHTIFMPFMTTILGPTLPLNASVTDTILSPFTC
jgi:Flp pilus assembly protein TadG